MPAEQTTETTTETMSKPTRPAKAPLTVTLQVWDGKETTATTVPALALRGAFAAHLSTAPEEREDGTFVVSCRETGMRVSYAASAAEATRIAGELAAELPEAAWRAVARKMASHSSLTREEEALRATCIDVVRSFSCADFTVIALELEDGTLVERFTGEVLGKRRGKRARSYISMSPEKFAAKAPLAAAALLVSGTCDAATVRALRRGLKKKEKTLARRTAPR